MHFELIKENPFTMTNRKRQSTSSHNHGNTSNGITSGTPLCSLSSPVKFRANHHKQIRPAERRKSAWALASPRFARESKEYHEAMMQLQCDGPMTPNRFEQQQLRGSLNSRWNNEFNHSKRPQTCINRRRKAFDFEYDEKYALPALEVRIPSTFISRRTASTHHDDDDDASIASFSSSQNGKRLELEYLELLPISSSMTDSHSGDHSQLSSHTNINNEEQESDHVQRPKNVHSIENRHVNSHDQESDSTPSMPSMPSMHSIK